MIDELLYIKASTLSKSIYLETAIQIKNETSLSKLLNTAPYFKTKPLDKVFNLVVDSQSFFFELPKIIDDQDQTVSLRLEDQPDFFKIQDGQILLEKVTKEGEYTVKLILEDELGKSQSYEVKITILRQVREYVAREEKTQICNVDLCKSGRICLKCKSSDDKIISWIYDQGSHNYWFAHQSEKVKVEDSVKIKIEKITRNGVIKLKFSEEIIVPAFIQDGKRRL